MLYSPRLALRFRVSNWLSVSFQAFPSMQLHFLRHEALNKKKKFISCIKISDPFLQSRLFMPVKVRFVVEDTLLYIVAMHTFLVYETHVNSFFVCLKLCCSFINLYLKTTTKIGEQNRASFCKMIPTKGTYSTKGEKIWLAGRVISFGHNTKYF